jgi:hypothetical protein
MWEWLLLVVLLAIVAYVFFIRPTMVAPSGCKACEKSTE